MLLVGTLVALTLVLTIILAAVYNQRVRLRSQADKLLLVEQNERRYSDLFNSVPDIIYVHSLDGTIIQVNHAAETVLGLGGGQAAGKPIGDFLTPRFHGGLRGYLSRVHQHSAPLSGILPIVTPLEGKLNLFEYRSSIIPDAEGRTVVRGIARNITERVAYERALQKAERESNRHLLRAREMQESLSRLSHEFIRLQEEDRRRISRELHDEIGQLLATITLNLELVRKNPQRDPSIIRGRIDDAKGLVEQISVRLHDFLSELRPAALDELGLLTAVRRLVADFSDRSGIELSFQEHTLAEALDSEQKLVTYRVIQEGLANAARHAHAALISITMSNDGGALLMEIRDNGRGFVFPSNGGLISDSRNHLGILGMQERVKLARGEFSLVSKPGEGTRIRVRIPVPGD